MLFYYCYSYLEGMRAFAPSLCLRSTVSFHFGFTSFPPPPPPLSFTSVVFLSIDLRFELQKTRSFGFCIERHTSMRFGRSGGKQKTPGGAKPSFRVLQPSRAPFYCAPRTLVCLELIYFCVCRTRGFCGTLLPSIHGEQQPYVE